MSDKEPKYFRIEELFSSDDYVVPIYQRNYDWEEDQITQLIQDIVDYITQEKSYYIGSLITYKRKLKDSEIYEIIDGQQRLTTLTILLIVLKNEYKIDLSWYQKVNLSFDSRKFASNTLLHLFKGERLPNNEMDDSILNGYDIIKKFLKKILLDNHLSIKDFCKYFFKNVIILRVLVPEDTDLNHYFEIMNSRGEQLEKHEILKARMLQVLEDENLKYAFNLIWEATSNMDKYVQFDFSVDQRNKLFGNDWNNLVDETKVYEILQKQSDKQTSEDTLTIEQILKKIESNNASSNPSEESSDRFNSIINFENFLLHVLRIQTKQDIPLDDKRLLKSFEPFLENDDRKEFVKKFGYNLLKSKFYFDKYIIKREFTNGSDHWSLKRLKCYDENNVGYVNTFDSDDKKNNDINREILMLLSMFHVSFPTLVYKHWLNAALKFVLEYSGNNLENDYKTYKTYLENLAKAFLFDRYLVNEPIDFFKIIYENEGKSQKKDIDKNKLNQGTAVENFIFNYLDYLLWQDYRSGKNYFKIKNGQPFIDNRVEKFEFTFRSSVEHYYPQNPIDENLKLKEEDAPWLDNFGNLCLISSSKNSRLSNLMPVAKKEYYNNSQIIDSIKQRIMMEYEEWDIKSIDEHGNKMTELLTNNQNVSQNET